MQILRYAGVDICIALFVRTCQDVSGPSPNARQRVDI